MLQFLTAVEDEIQGALDSFIKNIFLQILFPIQTIFEYRKRNTTFFFN